MARLQRNHWWFDPKRRVASAVLERHAQRIPSRSVLEVGCGTGAMVPLLARHGDVVGLDNYLAALAHVRGVRRVAGSVLQLPFPDATFGLVAGFDLLYHRNVVDVDKAATELARVVSPGGWVLITDSSCSALYGPHDRVHHGARRFSRSSLRGLPRGRRFVHGAPVVLSYSDFPGGGRVSDRKPVATPVARPRGDRAQRIPVAALLASDQRADEVALPARSGAGSARSLADRRQPGGVGTPSVNRSRRRATLWCCPAGPTRGKGAFRCRDGLLFCYSLVTFWPRNAERGPDRVDLVPFLYSRLRIVAGTRFDLATLGL